MVTYPITVRGSSYRGSNPKKRAEAAEENRAAAKLTEVINGMLYHQKRPIQVYGWPEIAVASELPISTVARLGFSIECGSNGFTAIRRDLTYEQALEANRLGEN